MMGSAVIRLLISLWLLLLTTLYPYNAAATPLCFTAIYNYTVNGSVSGQSGNGAYIVMDKYTVTAVLNSSIGSFGLIANDTALTFDTINGNATNGLFTITNIGGSSTNSIYGTYSGNGDFGKNILYAYAIVTGGTGAYRNAAGAGYLNGTAYISSTNTSTGQIAGYGTSQVAFGIILPQ